MITGFTAILELPGKSLNFEGYFPGLGFLFGIIKRQEDFEIPYPRTDKVSNHT